MINADDKSDNTTEKILLDDNSVKIYTGNASSHFEFTDSM